MANPADSADSAPRWHVEGSLSDERIAQQRARIGRTWETSALIDRGAIDTFVRGVGDSNPLWTDGDYARSSVYGGPIAPPSMLYRVGLPTAQHGLRGVHGFNLGAEWEFLAPVRPGDTIRSTVTFAELSERPVEGLGPRAVVEHYRSEWRNQRGQLVARCHATTLRAERRGMREGQRGERHARVEVPHPWSEEERLAVERATVAEHEQVRGRERLYWEDLAVGDELPVLVKGPFRMWDMIGWFSARGILDGFSQSLRRILATPGLGLLHPASNAREPIEVVHFDNVSARSAGLPGAYDLGAARQAYLLQAITHAIGDDGWVMRNECRYRRFVFLGDALWLRNVVTRRWRDDDGEYCVELEGSAVNQRDEVTMTARSVVALPSRASSITPADRRARLGR